MYMQSSPRAARGRVVLQVLAVLGVTAALTAGLLELALRLFAPQIVPPITGLFVADPATAYRLKPGAHIAYRFADGATTVRVNAQGLRADHDIGAPAPGQTRLLVLGDSFVLGMGVDGEQAFPALLNGSRAADGTPVESLNAGVYGYGTDNEAAWLRTYGWPLAPQLVLLGFFVGNDVKDNLIGMDAITANAQGQLVASAAGQAAQQQPGVPHPGGRDGGVPPPNRLAGWLTTHSHAYVFLSTVYARLFPPAPLPPSIYDSIAYELAPEPPLIAAGWRKTVTLLDGIAADTRAHGVLLVVVAIPAPEQVHDSMRQDALRAVGLAPGAVQRDLPQQHLAAWSARAGVPLIDLLPAFEAAGRNRLLYFPHDGHWNAAGHALAAQEIQAGLIRLGLFK